MRPTPEKIRAEIEAGPLADVLRPHWLDVFGPHPTKREELRHREGMLRCDAAFAIHKLLKDRLEELGWELDWKDVLRAHQDRRRREA